jgi:hypothetical protein
MGFGLSAALKPIQNVMLEIRLQANNAPRPGAVGVVHG